ncbi:hypothetical protein [Streptomyces sp. NPDC101178]|uniref:hypothetical protein n=1 Tax=Streptomyces sp. NPDC101178 TaxID=3366124 RepID=UPI00381BEEAF
MIGHSYYQSHPLPYLLIVVLCSPVAVVLLWNAYRLAVLSLRGVAVVGDDPEQRSGATFTVDGKRYRCNAHLGPVDWRGNEGGAGPIVYDPRKPRRNDARYGLRPAMLVACGVLVVFLVTAVVWASVRLVAFF